MKRSRREKEHILFPCRDVAEEGGCDWWKARPATKPVMTLDCRVHRRIQFPARKTPHLRLWINYCPFHRHNEFGTEESIFSTISLDLELTDTTETVDKGQSTIIRPVRRKACFVGKYISRRCPRNGHSLASPAYAMTTTKVRSSFANLVKHSTEKLPQTLDA
jgi:hypothetical protein